jgi:ubiquinone/menaquinone biosynthesis C-methylase UbiE
LYQKKTSFFDGHAKSPWAFEDYTADETAKLDRLFEMIGSLEGLSILEPGCGTGRLTQILAHRVGDQGRVVAIDISSKMIELARRRVKVRANVVIQQQALEELPLQEKSFDLIMCHQVFPHLEDKAGNLMRMAWALKFGGRLIIFHLISFEEINDMHRKAGTAVEHDLLPGREEMARLFSEAGLRITLWEDTGDSYLLFAEKAP